MREFYHYGMHAFVRVDDKGKKTISKYGRIFNSVKELKDFEETNYDQIKDVRIVAPEVKGDVPKSSGIDRDQYLKLKGE